MWNKNEREGKIEQVKGKVKQTVGEATDDPQLIDEGIDSEVAGKVQETVGTATRKVGETVEKVGKSLKR